MPFPTMFVLTAMILTVAGLISVLRYRIVRGAIFIVAGLVLGLVSGNHLN